MPLIKQEGSNSSFPPDVSFQLSRHTEIFLQQGKAWNNEPAASSQVKLKVEN